MYILPPRIQFNLQRQEDKSKRFSEVIRVYIFLHGAFSTGNKPQSMAIIWYPGFSENWLRVAFDVKSSTMNLHTK